MGSEFYESQPVFRRELERCAALFLSTNLEVPLLDVMFKSENETLLRQATYTQPALFAVEWATAAMWKAWGIAPTAVAGHSLGEFAAAAVAGIIPLRDAIAMVVLRGRLINDLPSRGGGMLSVFASVDDVVEQVNLLIFLLTYLMTEYLTNLMILLINVDSTHFLLVAQSRE